jgi:6-phosphofructokinase 1
LAAIKSKIMTIESNVSKPDDYNDSPIKRIGVLTSGGDAPGMNAAIRAVVRTSIFYGREVVGIYQGYKGLIENNFKTFDSGDVSNIIQLGGTILKTARSKEFLTKEGRERAYKNLKDAGIDALVAIGGDGTFTGARIFSQEFGFPIVGVPGTIDNDLFGTDFTIGYDTALNTIIEAVDKIRDTATAHERLFFIEVMGRDAGFLALNGGIASGAEAVLIPETDTDMTTLENFIKSGYRKSKNSSIVLVAEGEKAGGALIIAKQVEKDFPQYDVRVTILGHIQRGGSPSASDRILASRLGMAAVETLLDDQQSVMVGMEHDEIVLIPFNKAIKYDKKLNPDLFDALAILSS